MFKRLQNLYFTFIQKYQGFLLVLIGAYLFIKGVIESAPGIQFPQSQFLEAAFGANIEGWYALLATAIGIYLMTEVLYRGTRWWYAVTRNVIYVSFLMQIWAGFTSFTSIPPYNILGILAVIAGTLLASIYVAMGVQHGTK